MSRPEGRIAPPGGGRADDAPRQGAARIALPETEPGLVPALRLAVRGAVIRRAATIAAIVGPVLAAINHGERILGGAMTAGDWSRVGLTFLVPYTVSTVSSVLAIREQARVVADRANPEGASARGPPPAAPRRDPRGPTTAADARAVRLGNLRRASRAGPRRWKVSHVAPSVRATTTNAVELCARGLSTRDVEDALAEDAGPAAPAARPRHGGDRAAPERATRRPRAATSPSTRSSLSTSSASACAAARRTAARGGAGRPGPRPSTGARSCSTS